MSVTTAPPVKTLEVAEGTTLGYREMGAGPAVLLVHGWPTSSFLWREVMPAIAETNRVLAIDLPGFGASDKPPHSRYTFADFEQAIDGFLATLQIDQVAVAAHDIGGPVAVHWALIRPGRVTRLALLNTLLYPEFDDSVIQFVIELATPATRAHRTSDAGLAEVMRLGVHDPAVIDDAVLAGVFAPFDTADERRALALAGIGLEPHGFTEIAAGLGSLTMPVRAIYGEDDRVLPDVATTMARLAIDVPHAEVTAIPDCGHFLQEEAPELVGQLLAEFFRQG
jgi:pimeloyl-ACP methyl ester carboxylesterase